MILDTLKCSSKISSLCFHHLHLSLHHQFVVSYFHSDVLIFEKRKRVDLNVVDNRWFICATTRLAWLVETKFTSFDTTSMYLTQRFPSFSHWRENPWTIRMAGNIRHRCQSSDLRGDFLPRKNDRSKEDALKRENFSQRCRNRLITCSLSLNERLYSLVNDFLFSTNGFCHSLTFKSIDQPYYFH